MKQSTANFLENYEKTGNVRDAIQTQVKENRFYFYAEGLRNNSAIASLIKKGCEKTLAEYLRVNELSLGIPVKLTHRGILRMANFLILSAAKEG